MAASKQNLLLFGALGFIGVYITDAIVKSRSEFGRIVIFTSPSTAESKKAKLDELKSQGVEVIVGDIGNEEEVLKAYEGIDTILSFVGRTGLLTQLTLLNLALTHSTPNSNSNINIKRFFPSEYGTDIEYDSTSPGEPTHQLKLKVRAALRAQSKIDYTFIVTGPYVEGYIGTTASAPHLGSFDVKGKKARVIGDGRGGVSVVTMPDVGKLTLLALLAPPEVVKNRALRVNSFTTTPLSILAEYERQTGGQKWDVEFTSLEDVKKGEKKAYENGDATATTYTLRRIWAEGRTLYEERDNGVLGPEGEKMEGLEVAVGRAIEVQEKA